MTQPAGFATRSPALVKTGAYYVVFLIIGLSAAILGPTLPWLAENARTSLSEISLLFAVRSLGGLLGSALGGRLYDRRPGHPVLAGLLLIMAIALALIPAARQLWVLVLIVFMLGAGEITLDLGGNTLLMWVHGARVAPYMNGLHFFFGVGAFLSPILVAQAILIGGVQGAYWILALLTLPVAGLVLRLKSPSAQVRVAGEEETRGATPGVVPGVARRLILLFSLFMLLYVGAEVSFGGWIYSYAVTLNLATEVGAAYLTSAFWGSLTLGRLIAIPVSTRLTPQPLLLIALLGSLVSMGLILLWPASSIALWVGTCGLGLSMAPIFPTTLSFSERRMAITGKITGWFFVGATLGAMFLPWLIGQLFTRFTPYTTMTVIAGALMGALLVYLVLVGVSRRLLTSAQNKT